MEISNEKKVFKNVVSGSSGVTGLTCTTDASGHAIEFCHNKPSGIK